MAFRKINIPHELPAAVELEDQSEDSSLEDIVEGQAPILEPEAMPVLADEEVATDDWKHNLALPAEDGLQRDWSRYNRKLAFMYPIVVIPAWRRKR